MRRFVIITELASDREEKLIMRMIDSEKFGWWKYLSDSWLVVTSDVYDQRWFASNLRMIVPDLEFLVIEVDDESTWAGRLPPNAINWLRNEWSSGSTRYSDWE